MKNVVITGFGIKSCIGNTYDEVLSNLQNGKESERTGEKKKKGKVLISLLKDTCSFL